MIFDQLVQQPKLEEHMANMTSLNIARTNIFSRHLHQRRSRGAKRMLLIVYQESGQDFPSFLKVCTFELVFWNCKGGTEKAPLLEVVEKKNKPCVSVIPAVSFEPKLYIHLSKMRKKENSLFSLRVNMQKND